METISDAHDEHDEDDHRPPRHEEHATAHEEPWLVSYADMMTLLFGFFVLMYTFAKAKLKDDDSMVKMRKELAAYFGGEYVIPFEKEAKVFAHSLKGTPLEKELSVEMSPEGISLTFQSTQLFASGQADLKDIARSTINKFADMLKSREDAKAYIIRVEGHTDDVPINVPKYPSNWELSAARAASVVRLFEERGFSNQNLVAIGYGESKPLFPNRNQKGVAIPENQAQNRRVKIKVAYPPQLATDQQKLASQETKTSDPLKTKKTNKSKNRKSVKKAATTKKATTKRAH